MCVVKAVRPLVALRQIQGEFASSQVPPAADTVAAVAASWVGERLRGAFPSMMATSVLLPCQWSKSLCAR